MSCRELISIPAWTPDQNDLTGLIPSPAGCPGQHCHFTHVLSQSTFQSLHHLFLLSLTPAGHCRELAQKFSSPCPSAQRGDVFILQTKMYLPLFISLLLVRFFFFSTKLISSIARMPTLSLYHLKTLGIVKVMR